MDEEKSVLLKDDFTTFGKAYRWLPGVAMGADLARITEYVGGVV